MAKKGHSLPKPKPQTDKQKLYINAIETTQMVITLGPAGTGKTYIPACMAAYMLKEKIVDKILITRPNVPTGRSNGYLPGDINEKLVPWCIPVLGTLKDALGQGDLECKMKSGAIEIVPFETIRGRSFENCFVILDEAQNCTYEEIKAFTTRVGRDCVVVINGDVTQSDLFGNFKSGLSTVVRLVKDSELLSKYVSIIEFGKDDIVRSGLCQFFVEEFEDHEKRQREQREDLPNFLRDP